MSPLTRASEPRTRAGRYAGAAVHDARRAKERTNPELLQSRRCKLVVLAIEVGGRWGQEATTFLRLLAEAKARTIPARLKTSFTNSLIHRWSAQITHAAMTAYAASLLEFDCVASTVTDGNQPLTSDVLAEGPPPHPRPAESPPAPKEQRLGLGLVALHIRNRRYINGTCLEAAQKNSSNQTLCEEKGAEKKQKRHRTHNCIKITQPGFHRHGHRRFFCLAKNALEAACNRMNHAHLSEGSLFWAQRNHDS